MWRGGGGREGWTEGYGGRRDRGGIREKCTLWRYVHVYIICMKEAQCSGRVSERERERERGGSI